jgi:hypothetical protein
MKLFMIINNINDLCFQSLKYWICEQASKWIIRFNKNNSSEIIFIIDIKNYSKMSNLATAILNHINKKTNQSYNLSNLFKIKKEIKTNDQLIDYLQNYFNDIENLELKGYSMKYLVNILNTPKKDNNQNICIYCNKEFKTLSSRNKHQKFNCHKNENKISMNKNELTDDLIDKLCKKISENNMKIINNSNNKTINNNTINNNTTNNNTININLQTKIEKLNFYCNDTIDMDTFIKNYETNEKYQLTKEESALLLENIDNSGINSYGNGLASFLKRKYCLQFNDITGKTEEPKNCVLPFVSSDINLRSYYEKAPDGWMLVSSNDNIMKLLNISDEQIFNHHSKPVYYPKKGKKPICNILLRKSDYLTLSKKFSEKEKEKEEIKEQ